MMIPTLQGFILTKHLSHQIVEIVSILDPASCSQESTTPLNGLQVLPATPCVEPSDIALMVCSILNRTSRQTCSFPYAYGYLKFTLVAII